MMRRMLGAPLGGTTRGGHQGFDCVASSLMTPPNFIGGGGSCLPSRVIVASGEPGVPMICCAAAGATANAAANTNDVIVATTPDFRRSRFMLLFSRAGTKSVFSDAAPGISGMEKLVSHHCI